jgi:hypothetical protein
MTLTGRRNFLAQMGLATGGGLLSPMVDALVQEAWGQASQPGKQKRFFLLVNGNGLHPQRYEHPTSGGSELELAPATPLRNVFRPLEPFKRDLLILERFYVPMDRFLHGNESAALTLQSKAPNRTPGGISPDRLIARAIGGNDPFLSLNFAHYDPHPQGTDPPLLFNYSADGAGKVVPPFANAVKAFNTVFGAGVVGGMPVEAAGDRRALLTRNKGILDLVRGDVARLHVRLAGPERQKLEQYLESLRELEERLGKQADGPAPACAAKAAPAALDRDKQSEINPEMLASFVDTIVSAFACRRTHVASMHVVPGASHTSFRFLGDTKGHHMQCHEGNSAMIEKIDTYICGLLAGVYAGLRAFPEGNGTMADNTLCLWVNDGGGQHHNGWDDYAAVMVGSAGGALRTGRYVKFGKGQRSLADVYTTVFQAMGVPVTSFGSPSVNKGPLPGLT